jgi:hypothetical protein
MLVALLTLFFAIFSLNAAESSSYSGEEEEAKKTVDFYIPKGGLMDCIKCPSYCFWGDPGKNIPK